MKGSSILIIASVKDLAAMNIASNLISHYNFAKTRLTFRNYPIYLRNDILLAFTDEDTVFISNLDKHFSVKEIIVASRHESKMAKPTLSVHTPGNFGYRTFGGRPREVAWANPQRVGALLLSLFEQSKVLPSYSVTLEVTHHGPTEMSVPITFVEIGSSSPQWRDNKAGSVVANAIWNAIHNPSSGIAAIGFGGGHYAPKFTKISLEKGIALGHIVSKHDIKDLDGEIVMEAIGKTVVPYQYAIFDWKGMKSEDRRKLMDILRETNLQVIKA